MYQVGQEVAMTSFFLSWKDPGHYPGVWWLSSSLGTGCGYGAGCRAGGCSGFRSVLLCLQIKMKIKTLNSIKNRSILSLSRKSL